MISDVTIAITALFWFCKGIMSLTDDGQFVFWEGMDLGVQCSLLAGVGTRHTCMHKHTFRHSHMHSKWNKRSLEKIDERDLIISLSNSNVPTYHYLIKVKHVSKPVQLFPVKGKLNRALVVDHFGSLCLHRQEKGSFCQHLNWQKQLDHGILLWKNFILSRVRSKHMLTNKTKQDCSVSLVPYLNTGEYVHCNSYFFLNYNFSFIYFFSHSYLVNIENHNLVGQINPYFFFLFLCWWLNVCSNT